MSFKGQSRKDAFGFSACGFGFYLNRMARLHGRQRRAKRARIAPSAEESAMKNNGTHCPSHTAGVSDEPEENPSYIEEEENSTQRRKDNEMEAKGANINKITMDQSLVVLPPKVPRGQLFQKMAIGLTGKIDRDRYKGMISRGGGRCDNIIHKRLHCVVSTTEAWKYRTQKVRKALKHGIPIVLPSWIDESSRASRRLPFEAFTLDDRK
eukprot:jgi/Bigna1/88039/estExt_fgenesh1_pg.C_270119